MDKSSFNEPIHLRFKLCYLLREKHSFWLIIGRVPFLSPIMNSYVGAKAWHFSVWPNKNVFITSSNNLKYFLSSCGVRSELMKVGCGSFRVTRFSFWGRLWLIILYPLVEGSFLYIIICIINVWTFFHCYVIGWTYQVWIFSLIFYKHYDGFSFLLFFNFMKLVNLNNMAFFYVQLTIFGNWQYSLSLYTWWEDTVNLFVFGHITKIFIFMLQQRLS